MTPSARTTARHRTSDTLQRPDDRRRPDVRHHLSRAKTPDVRHAPDDRTLASHRTSGTCRTSDACAPARVLGRSHLPFHSPRLYILLHLLLVRVSVVIAHLRDRATLIHYGSTPRERPRPLYGEDPLGFKTPSWVAPSRPPHGEEPVTFVSSLVDFGSCISSRVFRI